MEFGKKREIVDKSLLKKKVIEENKRLSCENSTLSKTIEGKKKEIKSIDKELKSIQKDKVSLQKSLDKDNEMKSLLGEKITSLSTEKKLAEMEVQDIISQVQASDKILDSAEKELNKIEKRIEHLESKKKEYTGIQSRISKAKQELKDVKLDIKASEKALEDIRKEFGDNTVKQNLEATSIKRKLKAQISKLNKEIETLTDDNESLKEESQELSSSKMSSIASMEAERIKLKDDILELQRAMRDKINDESEKIGKLANIADTRAKQVEVMQQLSKKVEKDLAKARKRYEDWRISTLDEVASMKLKGKLKRIDKAGLSDVLNK